ncbi:RNA-directed DNA polymerase from mobile element jockey [Trichonephila clavipes]|nr:RNA-directed DNA polymerase from mobile element jockey [Trichonephila clavipes]
MGLHYSPEDKVDLFADSLESSFQENPEPYDDDFIDHVEDKEWKHALITVIPKPGKDKRFTENYRPISLISSLGKIFEKILLKKINSHCEEYHIIPDFQHGFRQQTSPQHQLLRVTNHIINGQRPILASTPQGSILSPALYNIYTSDFPSDNNTTVCLFADDAAILCTKRTAEDAVLHMQQYIMQLELWLTKWRIAINTDKTHAIVFRKQRTHNSPPTLQIFNQTIDWTFETKYLGLILNDKLTYSSHFKEITKKYWKKLYSLNDIIGRKSKLSLKNRLFVYKQYVRPLLLYGCAIWGSAGYVHIDNLQRLQNKALRTIARVPRFLPRYILHEELRVEPIHTIIAELASNFHSSIPYHNNATINSQNHFRNLPPSTHRMPHTASSLISSF